LTGSRRFENEMEAASRRQEMPDHDQLARRLLPEEIDVNGEDLVETFAPNGKVSQCDGDEGRPARPDGARIPTSRGGNRGRGPVDRQDRSCRQPLAEHGHCHAPAAADLQQPVRRLRRNGLERPDDATGQRPWRARRQVIIR
jgi:hypothetical protein